MTAAELIKLARLDEALVALEGDVRKSPADSKLRVFLFQLLAVLGKWDRAATQLEVVAEMNPQALLMAQACRQAILCEHLRSEVFAGKRSALLLGEPDAWVQQLIAAMSLDGQGNHAAAAELRAEALEAAPASAGFALTQSSGGEPVKTPFEWIADADPRLGPMLEAMVGGKYYWVPWHRVRAIIIDKPVDLRDTVWAPARFLWTTGAAQDGFIPARYSGSEVPANPGPVRMARETQWVANPAGDLPVGQRLFATDAGEFSLFETRSIQIGDGEPEWPSDRMSAGVGTVANLPKEVTGG
ncbi:MAG: type VI secretion system accessory protein TagJ [Phycisphaerales bacterium]